MQKGTTYHQLLSSYIEGIGQHERQACQADLALDYPSCADIRLAKAVSFSLPTGEWQVDLIVKPIPGEWTFRRQVLRKCRNQREAQILAAYSEKVMEVNKMEADGLISFN
jgi:hypothetical protein